MNEKPPRIQCAGRRGAPGFRRRPAPSPAPVVRFRFRSVSVMVSVMVSVGDLSALSLDSGWFPGGSVYMSVYVACGERARSRLSGTRC